MMPKRWASASSLDQHRVTKRAVHRKTHSVQVESRTQHYGPKPAWPLHNLPSPHSDNFLSSGENNSKREEGDDDDDDEARDEKRPVNQTRLEETAEATRPSVADPVEYWVQNECQWSDCLKQTTVMDESQASRPPKRRSNSSTSWRQSTLSGNTPKAWGRKHAAAMLEKGIFMERQKDATITDEDTRLCKVILEARYELPDEWRFREDNFLTILKLALYKNERRVVRDVEPHIMPSPELLREQGHPGLEHTGEAMDAQWSKCTSLCGPKTKPDMIHGLLPVVFTLEEREKLTANNTCSSEAMMFPFYICEAKSLDKPIEESELQAMHGASVASNAVIELYQKFSAAEELDRRILAFSVSHNQRLVKIFAHFALIDGSKITFHRHRLFETDLLGDSPDRHRPYHIALGIWEHFFPIHRDRVRGALARQPSRAMESFPATLGLEEDLASGASTPLSSQEDSPAMVKLQQENLGLLNRIIQLSEEFRHHKIETGRQQERQSEQHREEMGRLAKQHQEQMEQQREHQREIIALLQASRS